MTEAGRPDAAPASPASSGPFLDVLRSRPWVLGLLFGTLLALAGMSIASAHDALNRPLPNAAQGRLHLQLALCIAVAAQALAMVFWGRSFLWLGIAWLLGLRLFQGAYVDAFAKWGVGAEGLVSQNLVMDFALLFPSTAAAAWSLHRAWGRPKWTVRVFCAVTMALAGSWSVMAFGHLERFDTIVAHADQAWTTSHGDPPIGVAFIVAGIVAATLLWTRRSRPRLHHHR